MTDQKLELRSAFSRYATGVTIVSCLPKASASGDAEPTPIGITVNSFTSVSLDPPMVLWCIDKKSGVFDAYTTADNYAITILRDDQRDISNRFATPDNHDFKEGEFDLWETGAPVLKERLAAFDCKLVASHDAGDHVILVGEIVQFDSLNGKPLIYVGGNYVKGDPIDREV